MSHHDRVERPGGEDLLQIHVVNSANQHLYGDELEAFFRARHDIYVEEKGWRDDDGTGLEKDQFDTDDAADEEQSRCEEVKLGERNAATVVANPAFHQTPNSCSSISGMEILFVRMKDGVARIST